MLGNVFIYNIESNKKLESVNLIRFYFTESILFETNI